jgi:hypothetical protein
MAQAMTLIGAVTLSSNQTSVMFSNIPQSYRDLVLTVTGYTNRTADNYEEIRMQFNGDTGANYSLVTMNVASGSPASGNYSSQTSCSLGVLNDNYLSNTTPGTISVSMMDYNATDKHKAVLALSGASITNTTLTTQANRWSSTSAVTSLLIYSAQSSSFTAGSTFYLYGVLA